MRHLQGKFMGIYPLCWQTALRREIRRRIFQTTSTRKEKAKMAASWLLGRAITRKYSTAIGGSPQTQHGDSWKLWRTITLFGAFPAIAICMVNTYLKHQEEHHQPRPPYVKYDYLCIRTKPFPWGDGQRTLFHNPKKNALPSGEFEEE